MIRSFRHKVLADLFNKGRTRKIRPDLVKRVRDRLTALHHAESLRDLEMPGWAVHPLKGRKKRWSLSVSGPWRLTFDWTDGDAYKVDLEQYH